MAQYDTGPGGTTSIVLPPATWRTRRPCSPLGVTQQYARYAPSRETAGAYTSPVLVRHSRLRESPGFGSGVPVRIQYADTRARSAKLTTAIVSNHERGRASAESSSPLSPSVGPTPGPPAATLTG